MDSLLIPNVPLELLEKLEELASRHQRSVEAEVVALLQEAMGKQERPRARPEPRKLGFLLTQDFLDKAKREGRD